MAAIDTIEVLDKLDFEHLNTADIYTVHADGVAGESVRSHTIMLPTDVFAARVIINNNYGATGSTIVAKVIVTKRTKSDGPTKLQSTKPLEWTSVTLGSYAVSGEISLSGASSAILHVIVAIAGTTAHLGTEVIIQVQRDISLAAWTEWTRLVSCAGLTAFKTDVLSTAAAGQKVIPVNNPTAGNLNHICKNIFILDATIANCEVCFQSACGADS